MDNKEFFQICKDDFISKYSDKITLFQNNGYTLKFKFKGFIDETENKNFQKDSFVSEFRLSFSLLYFILKIFDKLILKPLGIEKNKIVRADSFWVIAEIYPISYNYSKAFKEGKIVSFCGCLGTTKKKANGDFFYRHKKDKIFLMWLRQKQYISSHLSEKILLKKINKYFLKIFFYDRYKVIHKR